MGHGSHAAWKTKEVLTENEHTGESSRQGRGGEAEHGRLGAREDKMAMWEVTAGRGDKQKRVKRRKRRHVGESSYSVDELTAEDSKLDV